MRVRRAVCTAAAAIGGIAALMVFASTAPWVVAAQIRPDNRGDKDASIFGVDWSKGNAPLAGESREAAQKRILGYTPDPQKFPIPRTPWDGKPYLGGVFWPSDLQIARPPVPLEKLYRPEVDSLRERTDLVNWRNGFSRPMFHCMPSRMVVGNTGGPIATQIVHGQGFLAVFPEAGNFRIIRIDGGPRNTSRKPSYMGDAVGRWEGDTLVVEVTNFKDGLWLGNDPPEGRPPQTSSDALRIVEYWTVPDGRMLEYQAVVEDKKMLTDSWRGPKLRMGRTEHDAVIEAEPCFEDADLVRIEEEYQRKQKAGK
jgi:hypothetical protein